MGLLLAKLHRLPRLALQGEDFRAPSSSEHSGVSDPNFSDISETTKTVCDRARYKHSWLELSRRSEFCPFVPRP